MGVTTYALLGDGVLDALRVPAEAVATAWARDWGLAAPLVACRRAWEAPILPRCRARLETDGAFGWLAWPDPLQDNLRQAMFGADRAGDGGTDAELATAAAAAALGALGAALGAAMLGSGAARAAAAEPPAALRLAGSGAVLVELRCERHALCLLLDHGAVARLATPAASDTETLEPADYASLLRDQPVRLEVEAGRASVELGSLLALVPGDVIRLDSLADQPLAARAADGTAVLRGYLGSRNDHLALDLVAGAASSGEHA